MNDNTTHLMAAYARQPVSFVRGRGARLWDAEGREYLDAIAGVAVTSLGHAQPEIACRWLGDPWLLHTEFRTRSHPILAYPPR